eukprot:2365037-Amphidinium_carterae.1
MLTKIQSGSRGGFLKIGKIGLPAAPVAPDAAASAEPVLPDYIRQSGVPHLIVISCPTIQGRKPVGTTEWGTLGSGTNSVTQKPLLPANSSCTVGINFAPPARK